MVDREKDSAFVTRGNAAYERFRADRRQLGGILLVLGICATTIPLSDVTNILGTDNLKEATWLKILSLVAGLVQVVFGSLSVIVGYLSLVHDYGNSKLSTSLLVLLQAAWIPFATRIIEISRQAFGPFEDTQDYVMNDFIPNEYLPTKTDVVVFGILGLMGEVSYMVGFFGALALVTFAIYSFDMKQATTRDAKYYRSKLLLFSFVVVVAGFSQLLLGGYILYVFGSGPMVPSMSVAMYIVHYPEMSVSVGSFQMILGYFGIARYLGYVPIGPRNHQLQILVLVLWISMLVIQYVSQITLSLGDGHSTETLPSWFLLSSGINLLPAYLDYKMRTTPYDIDDTYYGIGNQDEARKRSRQERKKRSHSKRTTPKSPLPEENNRLNRSRETDIQETKTDISSSSSSEDESYNLVSNDFLQEDPPIEDSDDEDKSAIQVTHEVEYPGRSSIRLSDATALLSNRSGGYHDLFIKDEMSDVNSESVDNDPSGSKKARIDDDSDTPDDSTEVLEEKLKQIEREIYTDSMESFRKSLTEIL